MQEHVDVVLLLRRHAANKLMNQNLYFVINEIFYNSVIMLLCTATEVYFLFIFEQ